MNASDQIMNILRACGCNPAAAIDRDGNPVIKVNAPSAEPDKK